MKMIKQTREKLRDPIFMEEGVLVAPLMLLIVIIIETRCPSIFAPEAPEVPIGTTFKGNTTPETYAPE